MVRFGCPLRGCFRDGDGSGDGAERLRVAMRRSASEGEVAESLPSVSTSVPSGSRPWATRCWFVA